MSSAIGAGALYALTTFLVGFVLGTVRILLLAPHIGDTAAVTLVAPVMLGTSWFVCRWSVERLDVPHTIPIRSVMSVVAGIRAQMGPH